MSVLAKDIAAFTDMRRELETQHLKEWVVFHEGRFEGAFADFETAAESAQARFDRGPYLIRQVGAGPVQFSGGMILRPVYANNAGGV